MNFNPLVSIVIPVYNGSNYMREAIDSALAQTYNNIEVIVVNDGSKDNTEEIALSYGDKIRYFAKENGGQSSALNLGIEKMRGDYFSWLSHDDVYYPNKIEEQVKILRGVKENSKVVLFSNFDIINSKSVTISKVTNRDFDPQTIRNELLVASPINGCTLLIPKNAFKEVGLFNTKRPHTSDVELFFKMAENYDFLLMSESLIQSRTHSQQATNRRVRYHNYESNLFLIFGLNNLRNDEINIPSGYIDLANNWSKRGYKLAYKVALAKYLNSGGLFRYYLKARLVCEIFYFKKYLKKTLKTIIYKFKSW